MAIRTSLLILLAMTASPAALAQTPSPAAGIGATPDWTLDPGSTKATRRKGATKRIAAAKPAPRVTSPEEAEKASLAERRARFFAPKPAAKDNGKIPEFGGYNPDTMGDGSMKPGAMFKF